MTLLGQANWWAPRFMRGRPAPAAPVEEVRELTMVG
jgi:RND superfamily putative drug exporter